MKSLLIIGNLGKDAEKLSNGSVKISVAVPNRPTSDGEERKPDWFTVFSNDHDYLLPYLKKGVHVAVSGQMYFKEYEGKTSVNINADIIEFVGSRKKSGGKESEETETTPFDADPTPAVETTPSFLKRKKATAK